MRRLLIVFLSLWIVHYIDGTQQKIDADQCVNRQGEYVFYAGNNFPFSKIVARVPINNVKLVERLG